MPEPFPRGRRWPVWALVAAVLLTGTAVAVGLVARSPDRTTVAPRPTPSPTQLEDVDLSNLPIARGPFCDALDDGEVEDALGAELADTGHYDSGVRAAMSPRVRDLSHEYNCTFRAGTGAQARAWVFAEPVTPRVARTILRDTRGQKGCRPLAGAPTFGTPSDASRCRTRGGGRSVTLRGLFGDAWLTCQLSRPPSESAPETVRRAQQWCVRVATRLGARS